MNTAAKEWAAKVAARNEVETARAEARRPDMRLANIAQQTFDWTGGGAAIAPMESGKGVD